MKLNLPIHPTLRHPLTGELLQAVYVDKNGRARYPIMGGAPDDDDAAKAAADKAAADTAAAATKAAADAAAAKAAEDAKGGDDKDLGFPKDTPVAQMKPEQQAAYHLHQSRKHEGRSKEWQQAFGGKTAAEVAAELDTLRREKLSDSEKAVEDAKRSGREEAANEYAPKAVKTALKLLLGDMPEAEQEAEIELLDLRKFITESGDVDTDKVRRAATKIAPAGTAGQQRLRDFGAGDRRTDKSSGVKAGRDLYNERRGNKSTTTKDS